MIVKEYATHSMTFRENEIYDYSVRTLRMLRTYDKVENVVLLKWSKDTYMMRVQGIKTIYGQVIDNGFYDIVNQKLYTEDYISKDIEVLEVNKLDDPYLIKRFVKRTKNQN